MTIQTKFYINLDTSHNRRLKFLNKGWFRWDAISRDQVPLDVDKKMISYYNYPRNSHLGRCACFCSHMELYQYIIENQLNDVLICEDDAVLIKDLPTEYPLDSITYLGGFFGNQKITDNTPVKINLIDGINTLPPQYRVLMTMSIIIPTWHIAKEIVDEIESKKRYRAIDIMLGNMATLRYFEYPACFEEEGSPSDISTKDKKSNQHYRWVKIKT